MRYYAAFMALVMLISPTWASAQAKQDFTLYNETGYEISEVYVSSVKTADWEEDVMGRDVLPDGNSVDISFPSRSKACNYDLKVVYSDGEEAVWDDFDLCAVSSITLHYNRKTGATWADAN